MRNSTADGMSAIANAHVSGESWTVATPPTSKIVNEGQSLFTLIIVWLDSNFN